MYKQECPHCGGKVEEEGYLRPCRDAGCRLNGPVTYHMNCGSQHRLICENCGVIYDSADDEDLIEKTIPVVYMCRQCEKDGIQPGHAHCGETFWVPQSQAAYYV